MWYMYHKRIRMQLSTFHKMNLTYREMLMFRKVRDKKFGVTFHMFIFQTISTGK